MKICLFFLVFTLLSTHAVAQSQAVVLDPEAAVLNSSYAKQRLQALQNESAFKALVERLNTLRAELKELQDTAQVNGLTWGEEQKQSHRNTMQAKADELTIVRKQLDNQRNALLDSIQRELTPVLEKVVKELVAEKGYELIVNSRAVIFSTEQNTITQSVIDALDKETAKNAEQ